MGGTCSQLSRRSPKKRYKEADHSPTPEPRDPLTKDAALTAPQCVSEKVSQGQKDITRIRQQHDKDKNWSHREEEREPELLEVRHEEPGVLEGRREEAQPVLQTSCEQDTEVLTNSFQLAKAPPQDPRRKQASPQEAIQARMKKPEGSALSQVYQKHIQDYGSPGPFWEQELESLHHVIEMKNERIRELQTQLVLMESLKEKNLMLELRITALQQENEDLHFRAQSRAAMARQLWEDLLLGLEKETQDGRRSSSSSRRRSR